MKQSSWAEWQKTCKYVHNKSNHEGKLCLRNIQGAEVVVFPFAGDLVESERSVRTDKAWREEAVPSPTTEPPTQDYTEICSRGLRQASSKEPKPRVSVNLIMWFNIKHHEKCKKESRKSPGKETAASMHSALTVQQVHSSVWDHPVIICLVLSSPKRT